MSSSARIIAVVATVAFLVVAFIALSPGGDDNTTTTTSTTTAAAAAPPTTGTATIEPQAKPARPKYTPIVVRGGKPVGGLQRIELRKGDQARLQVSSPDTSDEVHIHGYDLNRDLEAGGRVRFLFKANAEGIFEIELEGAGIPIAELVVEP